MQIRWASGRMVDTVAAVDHTVRPWGLTVWFQGTALWLVCERIHEEELSGVIVAIDVLKWPGVNVQFIVAFVGTLALTLAVIPYGKRHPPGRPISWGQAMLAATYVFAVLFLAYGIVPHQWLTHEQNQLNWRADRIFIGHNEAAEVWSASFLPFDVTFQALGDIIVVVIYGFFLGLQIFIWSWWQKRGRPKPAAELPTSTYGRPLVRKG